MTPSRQYGDTRTGRGRAIAVATIATVSGLSALFAYHTSPGHAVALIEQAMSGSSTSGSSTSGSSMPPSGAPAMPAARPTAPAAGAAVGRGGRTAAGKVMPAAPTATGGTGNAARTFTGDPANTQWGIVQVKITVQGGKVVTATAVQSPHSSAHSVGINKHAVPILNREAVQTGTSQIDAVSGATVTSGGYMQSLQSALDAARL